MKSHRNDPRRYLEYAPVPNRTLDSKRTWTERIFDIRHAACLTARELSELGNIPCAIICRVERRNKPGWRPLLHTIIAIRRVEAIFREELATYLHKPHGWLRYREMRKYTLERYGGYRVSTQCGVKFFKHHAVVSFTGRTFKDIAQMDDVEAVRALKNFTLPQAIASVCGTSPSSRGFERAKHIGMDGILSAASRGHFMSIDEIARVMGHDQEIRIGQPNTPGQ